MVIKMSSLANLIVICSCIFLKGVSCHDVNSGVKVVLTKQALDYAATQAVEILARKVPETRINNVAGNSGTPIGNINYEITDAKITSFTKPSANVIVNAGQGLTMSLSGAGISANGDWRYQYKKSFIRLRDSGSFTASADGVSISASVVMTSNAENVPILSATGCHCHIDDVHFRLNGGASWLYNIFLDLYKNNIKREFEGAMCKEALDALNSNGAHELATLNLQASINDFLILNYRLTSAPIFGDNFMETNHVGRFLNDDVTDAAADMQTSLDRMVSVSISDATLNSASRLIFKSQKLHFETTISTDMFSDIMEIDVDGTDVSFNASELILSVSPASAPVVTCQEGSISVDADAEAKIDAVDVHGVRVNAILIKFSVHYQMNAVIQANKVVGSVINFRPTVTYSSLSLIDPGKINDALESIGGLLVPSIDDALAEGLPLPNVAGIQFQDSVLQFNDRHITVSTNAVYFG